MFSNSTRMNTQQKMRSLGHTQVIQAGQAVFGVDTGMQVRTNAQIGVACKVYHVLFLCVFSCPD